MHLQSTPTSASASAARWAWIQVAGEVELGDLRATTPGEARRAAVFDRMQAATSQGAVDARSAVERDLRGLGIDARVELREQAWIDGSAVLRVDVSNASGDALRAVDELLAQRGARPLELAELPPGVDADRPQGDPWTHPRSLDAARSPQWFAGSLGFDAAHQRGLTGQGVRVAVVDSGVDASHPELVPALARGRVHDRFEGTPLRSGHGTFVAGIVGGASTGLAPGIDLASSRTYGANYADRAGAGVASRTTQRLNAILALQDAVAPEDGGRGADVLVTSWGILDAPGVPGFDYDRAMATIAAAGAIVVAAAGNDGARGLAVPAQLDDVLAAGGVDRMLRWHPSASVGPSPRTSTLKPDLAAPVVDIRSAALGGAMVDTTGGPEQGFAGTSAAAPVVASLVALLTQAVHDRGEASPDLDEVRRVLPWLTRDADAPGADARTGHGVVDASRIEVAADRIAADRRSRRNTIARHGIALSPAC